jgi:hypothetical protein
VPAWLRSRRRWRHRRGCSLWRAGEWCRTATDWSTPHRPALRHQPCRCERMTHPLGLPGPRPAGENLFGASDVGRSTGKSEGHELRPVDRQGRAGVGICFPLTPNWSGAWADWLDEPPRSTRRRHGRQDVGSSCVGPGLTPLRAPGAGCGRTSMACLETGDALCLARTSKGYAAPTHGWSPARPTGGIRERWA